ncbi:hypothetical protein ACO0KY_10880 [Undibacterium sp. Dicai25W]|uniref:bestrophin-like domain n=1 Tax=Undibacterium sp. Dicai25W TaxID=3413034 RepID=UPI003BF16229
MHLIYNLPGLVQLAIFAVAALALMFVQHKITRIFLDKFFSGYKSDLALNIHTSVSTTLALIVAFSLVQAVTTFKQADQAVRQESVRINNLDRLLVRYGGSEDVSVIRASLRTYANSIIKDEWDAMQSGNESETTNKLFKPVSKGIIQLKPSNARENSIYSEMVKLADALADYRAERLEAAKLEIPMIFWALIYLLLFAKNTLSSFFERSKTADIVMALQMICFSSLIFLTYYFDEPFKGESGIKPTLIVDVLDKISKRTD